MRDQGRAIVNMGRFGRSNLLPVRTSKQRGRIVLRPNPAIIASGPPLESSMKRIFGILQSVSLCVVLCVSVAFAQPAAIQEEHGIQVENMDRSLKPGDDFYEYANGN